MEFFQILAKTDTTCSNDLGTCCTDPGLVNLLDIVTRIMDIFQIIVPIILLTMLIVQLLKLVINPEEKNGIKKITNRILAAMIIFFLPLFVEVVLNVVDTSIGSGKIEIAACWKAAQTQNAIQQNSEHKFINNPNERKLIINGYAKKDVQKRKETEDTASNFGLIRENDEEVKAAHEEAKVTRSEIVQYAISFRGQKFANNANWNGEEPYTPTNSYGFVTGVYKHFGINLSTDILSNKNTYDYIYTDFTKMNPLIYIYGFSPGDIIIYDNHMAMFTGNGNQIIHAKNEKSGIVIESNFIETARDMQKVKAIIRIKDSKLQAIDTPVTVIKEVSSRGN